jgi:hypothetical protein
MGLDMYLRARKGFYGENAEVTAMFPVLPEGVAIYEVTADVGYWRKANAIHAWFVDNVQAGVDGCQNSYVRREDITKLKEVCASVLADINKADTALPTRDGFFFGGLAYDDNYRQDLQATIDICLRALALPNGWTLEYHSSW